MKMKCFRALCAEQADRMIPWAPWRSQKDFSFYPEKDDIFEWCYQPDISSKMVGYLHGIWMEGFYLKIIRALNIIRVEK